MKTTKCTVCGREISNCNIKKHLLSHSTHPEYQLKLAERKSVDHDDLNCKYCNKALKNKNSLAQHEIRCSKNTERINTESWNKGKTKETDSRLKAQSETLINKQTGYNHYQEYLKDNSIAWGQKNMQRYKKYFLEEQNHCCAICGMKDEWNGKQLVFILDHIDGNADNNNRDNLRLVCPNCDSQLDTFKSKNKKSARAKYRNIKLVEKS